MTVRALQNGDVPTLLENSPAEIDTRAPFQSVKAAVSLFRNVTPKTSPINKRSSAEERVLEKETQHLMILREVDYYKQQLRIAEMGKSQALQQLQRANTTFQELTTKLERLSESRQVSIMAAEAAKKRVVELEKERAMRPHAVEAQKQLHKMCLSEIATTKEEIVNLRFAFDAAMAEKQSLVRKKEEVEALCRERLEQRRCISEEKAVMMEKLDRNDVAAQKARDEHENDVLEKEACLLAVKSAMEEAETKVKKLKDEWEHEEHLEEKIKAVDQEIIAVKQELEEMRTKDLNSLEMAVSELEKSKKFLEEVVAEEGFLRSSVAAAEEELLAVKRRRSEAEKAAVEVESELEKMQAELVSLKDELQSAMEPILTTIFSETRASQAEAEDTKKEAESLKLEARAAAMAAEEAENKLKIALTEAEFATKRSDEARSKLLESKTITISADAFNSMKKTIEEHKNMAIEREVAAGAETEAIKTRVKLVLEKTEVITKEKELIEADICSAMKATEMAVAAMRAVEAELQKRRQNEMAAK